MKVLVANRPGGERMTVRLNLDDLLPQVDVLSLHCSLTPATTGMIDAERLARVKRNAALINTARGGLVDAEAPADALRAGRLDGAEESLDP